MILPSLQLPRIRGGAALLSTALLLAACSSVPEDPAKVRRGDSMGALIDRESGVDEELANLPPGRNERDFLGRDVAQLDAYLGAPALTRREGDNEFRRYDLKRCRIYAVVTPAGGSVSTLSTGALTAGEAPPSFSSCTAGL